MGALLEKILIATTKSLPKIIGGLSKTVATKVIAIVLALGALAKTVLHHLKDASDVTNIIIAEKFREHRRGASCHYRDDIANIRRL